MLPIPSNKDGLLLITVSVCAEAAAVADFAVVADCLVRVDDGLTVAVQQVAVGCLAMVDG